MPSEQPERMSQPKMIDQRTGPAHRCALGRPAGGIPHFNAVCQLLTRACLSAVAVYLASCCGISESIKKADEASGRKFAVIIGIDNYRLKELRVKSLGNGAIRLYQLLSQEYGYQESNMRLFLDDKGCGENCKSDAATKEEIDDVVTRWLPAHTTEQDSVLFYFAGHGHSDGTLAPLDALPGGGNSIKSTWLVSRLRKLKARHKALIIDSCYSGIVFASEPTNQRSASQSGGLGHILDGGREEIEKLQAIQNYDNIDYYEKRPFFGGLTSARARKTFVEAIADRYSPFTAQLLRSLQENVDSQRWDHAFTFTQLAKRLELAVGGQVDEQQIPISERLGPGDGDMVFRPSVWRRTPTEERERSERTHAYALDVRAAERATQEFSLSQARALLERQWPLPGQADLRSFEWYYQMGRVARQPALPLQPGQVHGLAGPRGGLLAAVVADFSGAKRVRLWDEATGVLRAVLPYSVADDGVAMSTDGKQVFLVEPQGRLWAIATGKLAEPNHARVICEAPRDPAGRAGEPGDRAPSYALAYAPRALGAIAPGGSVAGDELLLGVSGEQRSELRILDPETGSERHAAIPLSGALARLAVSEDGALLAVASDLENVRQPDPGVVIQVFDRANGWKETFTKPVPYWRTVTALAFSGRGRWIAAADFDRGMAWPLSPTDGSPLSLVPPFLQRTRQSTLISLRLATVPRGDLLAVGFANGQWLVTPSEASATDVLLQEGLLSFGLGYSNQTDSLSSLLVDASLSNFGLARVGRAAVAGYYVLDQADSRKPKTHVALQGDRLVWLTQNGVRAATLDGTALGEAPLSAGTPASAISASGEWFALQKGAVAAFGRATQDGVEPRGQLEVGSDVVKLALGSAGGRLVAVAKVSRPESGSKTVFRSWDLSENSGDHTLQARARPDTEAPDEPSSLDDVVVSADGGTVAFSVAARCCQGPQIVWCSLAKGTCQRQQGLGTPQDSLAHPAISWSGRYVAVVLSRPGAGLGPQIVLLDTVTTKTTVLSLNFYRVIGALAFSRDERTLAVGVGGSQDSSNASIQLWNVEAGQQQAELQTPGRLAYDRLEFSADGTRLLSEWANAVAVFSGPRDASLMPQHCTQEPSTLSDPAELRECAIHYWGRSQRLKQQGADPKDQRGALAAGRGFAQALWLRMSRGEVALPLSTLRWREHFDVECYILKKGGWQAASASLDRTTIPSACNDITGRE